MDKKLFEIQKYIDESTMLFSKYIEKVCNKELVEFINILSKYCNIYIFSGIIRNFFLDIDINRDIDFVIDGDVDLEKLIIKYKYRKNDFGGYKIIIADMTVDLWFLKDTWALNYQKTIKFNISIAENILPYTSFFNFSSILFFYNDKRFIYTKHFLSFLKYKKIDLVYKPNANYALCIINSLYYADKLNLRLSNNIKKYLKEVYKTNTLKFEDAQLSHFGEVLYTNEIIKDRIYNL